MDFLRSNFLRQNSNLFKKELWTVEKACVFSPVTIKEIFKKRGLQPNRGMGQNFLVDRNVAEKIVAAAGLSSHDLVVEIGPGLGALTVPAARHAAKVIAVEIDTGLAGALQEIVGNTPNVDVVVGDALEVDFDRLVSEKSGGVFGQGGKKYVVLGNLPYYITTPLLMRLLTSGFNISVLVVMIQLEVAQRLAAGPGGKDYGSLSVAVQYYTEPAFLFRVPAHLFYPAPAVDSAVMRLMVRDTPAVLVGDEKIFFRVVRAAFAHRRKTLQNSLLAAGLGGDKNYWHKILAEAGIDPGRRGETLSLEEFARLADAWSKAGAAKI